MKSSEGDSASDPNNDLACEECGVFGAVAIGDVWLCERCYAAKGSCCAEAVEDDRLKKGGTEPTGR